MTQYEAQVDKVDWQGRDRLKLTSRRYKKKIEESGGSVMVEERVEVGSTKKILTSLFSTPGERQKLEDTS